ncbi:MAG TPA: hypothetical protein VFT79_03620 [Solirubrobacterales bacterium]|nr:hypothetical protein [Solirubrobacterales bacterium]
MPAPSSAAAAAGPAACHARSSATPDGSQFDPEERIGLLLRDLRASRDGLTQRAPRRRSQGIITRSMPLRAWLFLGLISAVLGIGAFFYLPQHGRLPDRNRPRRRADLPAAVPGPARHRRPAAGAPAAAVATQAG